MPMHSGLLEVRHTPVGALPRLHLREQLFLELGCQRHRGVEGAALLAVTVRGVAVATPHEMVMARVWAILAAGQLI